MAFFFLQRLWLKVNNEIRENNKWNYKELMISIIIKYCVLVYNLLVSTCNKKITKVKWNGNQMKSWHKNYSVQLWQWKNALRWFMGFGTNVDRTYFLLFVPFCRKDVYLIFLFLTHTRWFFTDEWTMWIWGWNAHSVKMKKIKGLCLEMAILIKLAVELFKNYHFPFLS